MEALAFVAGVPGGVVIGILFGMAANWVLTNVPAIAR